VITRGRLALRAGLALLALPSAVIAAWATVAPHSFYDDFPGGGRHWVSALPPYNEHLLRDFGYTNLTIALFLLGAAVFLERRLVRVALVAFVVGLLPHLGYHLTTTSHYSTGDNLASLGGFALEVVLALSLLALTREVGAPSAGTPAYARSPSRTTPS
jgi:hypothetical protein